MQEMNEKNMDRIVYKISTEQKHDFSQRKKLTQILWNVRDKRQLFLFRKVLILEGGGKQPSCNQIIDGI